MRYPLVSARCSIACCSTDTPGTWVPQGVRGAPPYRPYLGSILRPEDLEKYSAAGILAYRTTESSVDVLLGRQMSRGQGPSRRGTWSWIGGKREPGEGCSIATAAREAHEESLGHVTANWVEATLRSEPKVLWQPIGGYAIHLAEVVPEKGCAVADTLASLPAGEVLPLRRPPPPTEGGMDEATLTLAAARAVLDEHEGGPMLLSRLVSLMYQREPRARAHVKQAGGAQAWCNGVGILTARGPKGTVGMETAWLGRADTLEVDHLMWLPWILLATRADYNQPISLAHRFDVRVHPYLARLLESREAGGLLREHFRDVATQHDQTRRR